ncbi:MFS transporter [Pseudoclavibacter chungangensis]|uniref:MFS transporter n=1 Tax=Pseudoclavibacter chungangensis TaxID=587635 RepID=A0A7J5BNF1_9MICO|nr:MFS transporter [Pseudoclavibacter chungangensis]KAB1652981.1 MFS transporter [Pseudoclavibacter chungangensis]NYJ65219.1 MFS family permease [Pseudoclavibacter chungangensis]
MADDRREANLTQVVVIALLPALVFAIGEGAILPVIPTVAGSLGAGIELAGFVAGSIMIGQVLGDIPAGPVVARVGEKRAMLGSAVVSIAGVLLCVSAVSTWMLLAGVLVVGFSASTFNLARHAFLTSYVPVRYRARALSTLGGVFRAGQFIGPFITAAVIALTGIAQHAFWICAIVGVVVIGVLLFAPDVEKTTRPEPRTSRSAPAKTNVWSTVLANRRVLVRLGTGTGLIALLRGARTVVLPLWAFSIGLDAATTALVIGIAGGIDFALFFVSGWVMDRYGRAWTAVPSMLGMGVGLLALAFTHDLASAAWWFVALAIATGLANGIGSGIIMTLGADLAPRDAPAPFLGAWHIITDGASAAVPFIVAGLTLAFALPAAVGVLGVLGLVGAAIMGRYIPVFVPPPERR